MAVTERLTGAKAKPASEEPLVRGDRVLRFVGGERLAHWNHAISFLFLLVTGLALVARGVAGLAPRELLIAFGWVHRVAAVPFTLLTIPLLYLLARKTASQWLRDSFRLDQDDRRFLLRFARDFFGLKADLPEQGRFNGGEKVNSMIQIIGWPVMAVTGWMMVYKADLPLGLMQWVIPIHSSTAMALGSAALGHIYLATLHPHSKQGLSGMFSGWVPADWARAHYGKWVATLRIEK